MKNHHLPTLAPAKAGAHPLFSLPLIPPVILRRPRDEESGGAGASLFPLLPYPFTTLVIPPPISSFLRKQEPKVAGWYGVFPPLLTSSPSMGKD